MMDPATTQTLRALVQRIVPADDYPSGWYGSTVACKARCSSRRELRRMSSATTSAARAPPLSR